jgi:hypothetical protein
MFFAIFINMNKSATLKLDKLIQEILAEQTDPNSPFYVKPLYADLPAGALDVINDPNLKYSDRLKKTNYASIVPLIKDSPEVVRARTIAKTIYDAKGIVSDDMYLVVKAIKQIKDAKQFYLVQTELQKLTNGRGIGQYIASFLGTRFMGADLNLAETLRDGETIVKHLKSIKANPATIKFINDRLVQASMQKSITSMPFLKDAPGINALNAINAVNMWSYEHSTWDTFINGANGKNDGLRGASYSIGGIVVTTILAFIPQTKAITVAIFALLAADDIYRIANGNYEIETWVNLVIDLIGVMAGGVSSIAKGTIRPIAALLAALAKGVKGKALLPLIEAVQRMAGGFANTKFGQLLIKLGEGFVTFITSLINKLCTQFISALKLVATKYPKLTSWCDRMIKLIKSIVSSFGQFFGSVFKDYFKFIWKIISLPGKSADWIVQNVIMRKANIVVRGAFGMGAKVGVEFAGINYMLEPDVEEQLNQQIQDNQEKLIANIESAHAGNIIGFPKTGDIIQCYLSDGKGGYMHAGDRKTFYVPVTMGDTTTLQPVGVVIHQETRKGNWIEISMLKNKEEYDRGEFGVKERFWTDTRKLRELNRVPIDEYITIKPN